VKRRQYLLVASSGQRVITRPLTLLLFVRVFFHSHYGTIQAAPFPSGGLAGGVSFYAD